MSTEHCIRPKFTCDQITSDKEHELQIVSPGGGSRTYVQEV